MGSDSNQSDKLSLPALIAMVVGSMVGAGVFSLPRNFAMATGPSAPSSPGRSPAAAC